MKDNRALLAATLISCAALAAAGELGLRAWYRHLESRSSAWPVLYERTYFSVPPWVRAASILRPDPAVGAWMRPNARRRYINLFGPLPDLDSVAALFSAPRPELPAWALARPSWELRTNSEGMRGPEIPPKTPGRLRIAAVGDSWTLGVNVDEQDSYPAVLERLLKARGRNAEVLNFGRMGASGRLAAATLRARVLRHDPDVVLLAFGQTDEYRLQGAASERRGSLRRTFENSEVLALLLHLLERRRFSLTAALESSAASPWTLPPNVDEPCSAAGIADSPFARSMEEAVSAARAGRARPYLLYLAMPDELHCVREALRAVSRRTGAPLIDGAAALGAERARLDDALARRHPTRGLSPPPAPLAGLLLRVLRPDAADGTLRARLAFSGEGWSWRDLILRRGQDGAHSALIPAAAGQDAAWLFRDGPEQSPWAGVENYLPRRWRLTASSAGTVVAPPPGEFGRHTLRSDPFHTDAAGYAMIARKAAEVLKR